MPSPNNLKKMLIFTCEKNRHLIEGIIKDRSALTGINESVLIEQALMNDLIPSHELASFWLDILYNGGTLWKAYADFFGYMAAGMDWNAAQPNGRALVVAFSKTLSYGAPVLTGDEPQLPHLQSQLDTIIQLLPPDLSMGGGDREFCETLLHQLQHNPSDFYITDLVGVIARNWKLLGNHTRTYRALVDLAFLSAPQLREDPRTRLMYLDALEIVSSEWLDDEFHRG